MDSDAEHPLHHGEWRVFLYELASSGVSGTETELDALICYACKLLECLLV